MDTTNPRLFLALERRQVAEENTSLSMKNYAKASNAAAALGVNPYYAHKAIELLSSNRLITSLIPSSIRQKSVKFGLGLGLQTLSTLKSSNFLFGLRQKDFRIQSLENLAKNKQILPLIYPDDDLGFTYKDGVVLTDSVHRNIPDEMHNLSKSSVLEVGRRIPHCWFEVSTVQSGQDHQTKRFLLSSLDIILFGHRITTESDALLVSQPSVILLTYKNHFEEWQEALKVFETQVYADNQSHGSRVSGTIKVIGIEDYNSNRSANVNHDLIQHLLQIPHHIDRFSNQQLSAIEMNNMKSQMVSLASSEMDNALYSIPELEPRRSTNENMMKLTLYDISGHWKTVLSTFLTTQNRSVPYASLTIAIRPDNHVLGVYYDDLKTNEQRKIMKNQFLKDVMRTLHIYFSGV
jgi:hypothetical protein